VNERLVGQLPGMELMPCEWASYPGKGLVLCEWANGGPVIMVWDWCPMNRRLVASYPSIGPVPCE